MNIYDLKAKNGKWEEVSFEQYKGKVLIPIAKAMDKDYKNNSNINGTLQNF